MYLAIGRKNIHKVEDILPTSEEVTSLLIKGINFPLTEKEKSSLLTHEYDPNYHFLALELFSLYTQDTKNSLYY